MITTYTATAARPQLYQLIDQIAQSQAIKETLYLLSIPGMYKSILKEMKTPLNKCKRNLDW